MLYEIKDIVAVLREEYNYSVYTDRDEYENYLIERIAEKLHINISTIKSKE